MIYLSDNDIIEKLAICDLLDDALASFDASRSDVFVLPTLKFRLGIVRGRAKAERKFGVEALARLIDFLECVQEVRDYSRANQEALDDLMDIDPGEIILLSAAAGSPDSRLLTGDKRCLKAVATYPECAGIARRIQGRVVCFEQLLRRLIARFGFEHVCGKVVPVLDCDTALRAAFGSMMESTEPNAVACLQGYIDELRGQPIDLLMADD